MTERIAALAQRLRGHAEVHNMFVRSVRARDKWFVFGCVSLATPYAGAAPLFALAYMFSWSRHNEMIAEGACPIGHSNVYHFYVTRPCVPQIVSTVEKLGSIELAEESLIGQMCFDPQHRHFLYPKNWYKAPADTTATVKEDM